MADMIVSPRGASPKNISPRIDLTPMVDLGFLLLTFFVFSSTLTLSHTLHLTEPDSRNTAAPPQEVKSSGALTLLLGAHHLVLWYEGLPGMNAENWRGTTTDKIRERILDKKRRTVPEDFVVLIKPGNDSDYGDLIQIINELKICMVERYSIDAPDAQEQARLARIHNPALPGQTGKRLLQRNGQ